MLLGVVDSLEVEDASPASASLAALQHWMERVTAKEEARANARRERYLKRYGAVPAWVEHGMGARLARVEQVHHRVQMLLGIFSARGVLPCISSPPTTSPISFFSTWMTWKQKRSRKAVLPRCWMPILPKSTRSPPLLIYSLLPCR